MSLSQHDVECEKFDWVLGGRVGLEGILNKATSGVLTRLPCSRAGRTLCASNKRVPLRDESSLVALPSAKDGLDDFYVHSRQVLMPDIF